MARKNKEPAEIPISSMSRSQCLAELSRLIKRKALYESQDMEVLALECASQIVQIEARMNRLEQLEKRTEIIVQ